MNEKYVLIVDDDKDIQSSIKMILELHGYQALCASNGKEAFEVLNKGSLPEAILLDLMMPVMDGFEFMRLMEESPLYTKIKNIPIIVMTAARNKAHEIKKYKTLLKPFEVNKLLTALGE